MRPTLPCIFMITCAALAAACSVDASGTSMPDTGTTPIDAPDGGAGDGAPASDGAAGPDGLAPSAARGLAVLATPADFSSTRVSILGADGALVTEDCIHSEVGSGGGSSLTLSTDVTLPSQPQRGGELWVVDRGNVALLVLDPATCGVRRQLSVSTGFRANPHDVVVLSETKAYVTRYEKNLSVTDPASTSGGDDILVVNPATGAVTGRIPLASYAAPVDGATIQARPDRAVIAAGKVFVTLGSQDAHFAATGEGRVVVIDPATDQVTASLALTGLSSCSEMDVRPSEATLYVACGLDNLVQSGVALIDLSVDPPAVKRVVAAQVLGSQPLNFSWVAAVSPARVLVGTFGSFAPAVSDAVFAFDPGTGRAVSLASADAYNLGRASAGGGRLFVPDATAARPRILIFDVSGASLDPPPQPQSLDFDPAKRLLPREVAWF